MSEARRVAAKIVEDGRASIAKEVQSIQFDLGRDSEKLAREIASKVLGREIA
jgi:F0F1-type ATP synthase membrane subunit b/b'